MPTVAAGGGHILNIDFLLQFVKEATAKRAARAKTNTLLTKKKKKKENKEKKLFLNKEKLRLLLKQAQMQLPPLARRVARRVRILRNRKATVHGMW